MKVGLVVERNLVLRVGVAEYVPTAPAMVAPLEEVEAFLARGGIADSCVGIGLPVVPRRHPLHGS